MSRFESFRLVLGALSQAGRQRLITLAVLVLLGSLVEFALLAALINLLRQWLGGASNVADGRAVMAFVGIVLIAGVLRFALLNLTRRLTFDTGHQLIVAVQRRVLARDWPTHVAAPSSGPLSALQLTEDWLNTTLLPVLQGGASLVLALGIMAGLLWYDAPVALAVAALLALLFLLANSFTRQTLRRAGDTLGEGYDARIAAVQENVGALRELILAGARGAAIQRFRRIDRRLADARTRISAAQGLPRILVESVGLAALALAAWWLASREGGLASALPSLGALALGAQRLLPLLQTVNQSFNALTSGQGIQQRMATMLAEPDLKPSPPAAPLHFEAEVRLKGISFSYPGRSEPALRGIDLAIRRGERIALVGPNGSGKSTLADLIMGLLEPSAGVVLIDGALLTRDLLPAWHRNIAHVPQSPFVSDSSIAANVAFMDQSPNAGRLEQSLRLTGLNELVASLPDGIATRVGDRGQLLSGGQRQRLALARALYAPAPLLVLDEATSALDPASEAHVLRALEVLQRRGTTILIIAHRETMLAGCDRVLRLESGRLI